MQSASTPTVAASPPPATAATAAAAAVDAEKQFIFPHTVRLDLEGHNLLTKLAARHFVKPGLYLRQLLMPVMRERIKDETQ